MTHTYYGNRCRWFFTKKMVFWLIFLLNSHEINLHEKKRRCYNCHERKLSTNNNIGFGQLCDDWTWKKKKYVRFFDDRTVNIYAVKGKWWSITISMQIQSKVEVSLIRAFNFVCLSTTFGISYLNNVLLNLNGWRRGGDRQTECFSKSYQYDLPASCPIKAHARPFDNSKNECKFYLFLFSFSLDEHS